MADTDDFFVTSNTNGTHSANKRKRGRTNANEPHKRRKQDKKENKNEEDSDDLQDDIEDVDSLFAMDNDKVEEEEEEQEEIKETPDEKRLRLAKQYLSSLSAQQANNINSDDDYESDEFNDVDDEYLDPIGAKLRKQAKEARAGFVNNVSAKFANFKKEKKQITVKRVMRGHKLSPTCVALSRDDKTAYTGGKDCSFIHWDIETGKRIIIRGHRNHSDQTTGHAGVINCIANCNTNDNLIATGTTEKIVRLWDPRAKNVVTVLSGHRGPILGLAFHQNSDHLFSSSADRTIRIWNMDNRAYIETLFGHQHDITAIDAGSTGERAISVSSDRTARVWKVEEQTQLVFRGHSASIDAVYQLNDQHFITGSQDGSLSLYRTDRKRAAFTYARAHQYFEPHIMLSKEEKIASELPWITSIGGMRKTDVFASGSGCASAGMETTYKQLTNHLIFWRCDVEKLRLAKLISVPVAGFVNSIKFANSGRFCVAAVGQEHRLGRWWRNTSAKNSLQLFEIPH